MTHRELNQLKLQKLKGPDITTEQVLAKLLSASSRVGRRVARQIEPLEHERVTERIEPQYRPTEEVSASAAAAAAEEVMTRRPVKIEDIAVESKEEEPEVIPTPRPERTIASRSTSKRQVKEQAEQDLAQLTDEYPALQPVEQRQMLDSLRDKYHAPRKANVPQVRKLLTDLVQNLKAERSKK
jgi:hypothetical protein